MAAAAQENQIEQSSYFEQKAQEVGGTAAKKLSDQVAQRIGQRVVVWVVGALGFEIIILIAPLILFLYVIPAYFKRDSLNPFWHLLGTTEKLIIVGLSLLWFGVFVVILVSTMYIMCTGPLVGNSMCQSFGS